MNPTPRIPIVDSAGTPLAPCAPPRVRQLLKKSRAKHFKHPDGFAVQLVDKTIPPEDIELPG